MQASSGSVSRIFGVCCCVLQSQWQNLTRARFATEQTFSQYSPISAVDKVQAPLMIIAGAWLLAQHG